MSAIEDAVWACDPAPRRTEADWVAILDYLVGELGKCLRRIVRIDRYGFGGGEGHAMSSICSRVTVIVSRELDLVLHGVLCMAINHGESVGISAELMYFAGGKRLGLHRSNKSDRYSLAGRELPIIPEEA